MTPTSARRQVQPVDVDEREQRRRRDEAAAVEPLGQGHLRRARGRSRRARIESRAENAAGRSAALPRGARRSRRRTRARRRPRSRRPVGPPIRSARTPPANAASAPAAARPIPMTPTTRPRSRAGYIAPHRRRWNGPPNDRLSQKTIATATITGAVGTTNSTSSEAAPRPRMSASCAACAGPNRPANAPRKLATNGAAASADRPMRLEAAAPGDRRQERVDQAIVTPTPTADDAGRGRGCARARASSRDGGTMAGTPSTSKQPAGLRGELSGSAWVSPSRRVRDLPRGVGPPSSIEEVRPCPTIARGAARAGDGPFVRDSAEPRGTIAESEPSFGPVGMRGFDRAWMSESASRGCCSGLVNQAAKRSTWQPPVDSRPRCLGSKVSVEATSASRVVEASCSEAAIRIERRVVRSQARSRDT